VQEALHNVAKHARAGVVRASLRTAGDRVVIVVEDDGVGFDPATTRPGHLGLTTMHERVAAVGGRLWLDSAPGAGTRVRVEAPLGTPEVRS